IRPRPSTSGTCGTPTPTRCGAPPRGSDAQRLPDQERAARPPDHRRDRLRHPVHLAHRRRRRLGLRLLAAVRMIFPDLTIYDTGHPICQVITRALEQGSGGAVVPVTEGLRDGPAAVYGILRGCDRIIDECEWIGRDFYHVDHG